MSLKVPTGCCAVSLLLWDREKGQFLCPCGQTKINERGLPVGKKMFGFRGKPFRPEK